MGRNNCDEAIDGFAYAVVTEGFPFFVKLSKYDYAPFRRSTQYSFSIINREFVAGMLYYFENAIFKKKQLKKQ